MQVREITPHGIYVDLDEYNGMNGFLHISEISTGWVRNIDRVAKVGQKLVLKVVRAEKSRREVDLSLRQVTNEERRNKLIEWKQKEKVMMILGMVKKKLGWTTRRSPTSSPSCRSNTARSTRRSRTLRRGARRRSLP